MTRLLTVTGPLGPVIAMPIPAPTAGTCPIGFVHIATSSAATFTAGTTDLGAANVVDTFVNFVGCNPAQGANVAALTPAAI